MIFLLDLVPWYVWAAGLAFIVLVSLLQLWPVIFGLVRVAIAAFAKLPTEAKVGVCVIAGLAGLVVLHLWIVRERVDQAVAEERARGKVAIEQLRGQFQAQIQTARDTAQAKLDVLAAALTTEQQARAAERLEREKRHQRELVALKEGFNAYVSPLQLSRCSDVPRGYLVRRANAASYANGGADSAGPPASAAALDEPSGVSLAALDATDVEAAGAYRACRDRVAEWEDWGARVDRLFTGVQQALQPKKGVTQ